VGGFRGCSRAHGTVTVACAARPSSSQPVDVRRLARRRLGRRRARGWRRARLPGGPLLALARFLGGAFGRFLGCALFCRLLPRLLLGALRRVLGALLLGQLLEFVEERGLVAARSRSRPAARPVGAGAAAASRRSRAASLPPAKERAGARDHGFRLGTHVCAASRAFVQRRGQGLTVTR